MYHEVLPDDVMLPAWTIVRESDFKWQMHSLQKNFDVVSMNQALARISGKYAAKRPFAVVTFDDGYKGNLDTVLPIMESYGLPFLVYIATQAIIENNLYWYDKIISLLNLKKDIYGFYEIEGKKEEFSIKQCGAENIRWQAVQRLLIRLKQMSPGERETVVNLITDGREEGTSIMKMVTEQDLYRLARSNCVTIGAHTHRHELLDQLTSEEAIETIQTSNEHIFRMIGCYPTHFAYPNGNFNREVSRLVQATGYETAVTTMRGFWSNTDSVMMIPRIGIGRFDSKGQFLAKISGYL